MEDVAKKNDFSQFTTVDETVSIAEKEYLIKFFSNININIEDITTGIERKNHQKVVKVKYSFNNQEFITKPLYYKNILYADSVKDVHNIINYFGAPVFWLDIEQHDWPKPKGQTDIDSLIINDMTDDDNFKKQLKSLGNNLSIGYIQRITKEGRSSQYYRNLENNNHWHDLILLIQEFIKSSGENIDKKYFNQLVFKWDGNKNTDRLRSSLSPYFGDRAIIQRLRENIKLYKSKDLLKKESIKPMIDLLKYKKQIILQGPPGTGKTREAKLIAEVILNSDDLNNSEQFKLVQFHPSYTYEDFVRGTVAESKGDKIEYKNVNKILGEFAERAVKNFKASSKSTPESNLDVWIEEKFEDFKNNIEAKLPEEETILSGDISVFEVHNDHFKYGKKWQTPGYLKFGEFKKLVKAVLQKEIEPAVGSSKLNKEKFIHAHYRFTYYNALLTKFFNENEYEEPKEKIDLKNYVLIIDEINRANLSSVLGELIYALEYRGESVDSMYAIGEDNKLMLPPNLYIIGTMNTADRSVGHIDYAMRRRFAFVDVLPKDLSGEEGIVFDAHLFAEVSSLFVKDFDLARDYSKEKIERAATLSSEFDPKDVRLGHSYFIQQYEKDVDGKDDSDKPYDFNLRVEYEIKPILREYHKDGILIGDGIAEKIEALAASK